MKLSLTLFITGILLLITYNLPFLFTILQSALRFLIEALTFIALLFIALLLPAFSMSRQRSANVYLYLKMILPLLKSYGLISTPTLSPGKILM